MKITFFDITKYNNSIKRLEARKAPKYIIEAYKKGFSPVVNEYYRMKLKKSNRRLVESTEFITALAKKSSHNFITEALKFKDLDFLKLVYQMTNLDIFTGEKLPPGYSQMIKQGFNMADKTLKDVLNKLR